MELVATACYPCRSQKVRHKAFSILSFDSFLLFPLILIESPFYNQYLWVCAVLTELLAPLCSSNVHANG